MRWPAGLIHTKGIYWKKDHEEAGTKPPTAPDRQASLTALRVPMGLTLPPGQPTLLLSLPGLADMLAWLTCRPGCGISMVLPLLPWRRKWQPTPVLLPRKFYGWRNLVGYSPWNHKESDMTERLRLLSFFLSFFPLLP